ncbi:MAG: MFS transporter [Proteobacteria bacterium]|nr:MFS transporter [Pseudomonadota bacterium]
MTAEGETAAGERGFSPFYAWVVIGVLILLYTSSFIDRQIVGLMVKPIREDLQISDTAFSLLSGFSFALLYSIAGVPVGYAVDRWSRSKLIAIGVFFWSLMTFACGLVNTYWRLFAARVGVGIGEAVLSPASYSLVSDLFPPQRLARALSVYTLGVPLGSGLALLIGGPLVEAISAMGSVQIPFIGEVRPWQAVFLAVGAPGFLLTLLSVLVVREPPRHAVPGEDTPGFAAVVGYIFANARIYVPIFFGLTLVALIWYGAAAWYPAYLQRVHGFSVSEAGLFLGFSALVFGIIGTVSGGLIADRFLARGYADGHCRVGMLFSLGVLVCSGLGPIIPIKWLSLTLISLNALFAFTWIGVNAAVLQIVTPNRMRGQVSAIYLFVANAISLGLGATTVALATDYIFKDDNMVGASIYLVSFVTVILTILVMQPGRKHVAEVVRQHMSVTGPPGALPPGARS